jgi:DNA replication initiation complex subunit (GINS family)
MSYLEDAKELFGDMRNLTQEEQNALYSALNELSEPTGITLFDIEPRKTIKVKSKISKVSRSTDKLVEREQSLIIEKPFYKYEIDVLEKMCVECLSNNKFSDEEKEIIKSILENTLV